ncbi:hypothetical protein BS50DRAFT_268950 [Corynespora cassiicola Philippines]|uniref:LYR motif-containing protein Cup1-like N-terminal domain-containing protein n=1 Tax=Corynespora cassiicola Philippines TaxID=1448308 RepID=A0A2T2NZM4_CORCC|nr:hypothetical protein BS50DRAFT_268950 [Corynespora cassiicola Philippines]
MSLPAQHTASQQRSLHLLRALLREASYLPDAAARDYARTRVLQRFRVYQPAHLSTTLTKRHPLSVINARTRHAQKQAVKGLTLLRQASQGELQCLDKVMLLTYGRLGPRKHRLLERLLVPDKDLAGEQSPLQKAYHSDMACLAYFDAPKKISETEHRLAIWDRYSRLKAALTSQVKHSVSLSRNVKRPYLTMPIKNTWERPMPIKRARNTVRRWYAEVMGKLQPPLPNEEWDRLHALSTGKQRLSLVSRRTSARELDPQPADVDETARLTSLVHEALTLNRPSRADMPGGKDRPHHITPSFMRRVYGRVFSYCCKLEWDDEHRKWNVVWGSAPLNKKPYRAAVDDAFFAGVTATGKLPKSSTPIQSAPESALLAIPL